ncbi:hypothetical protein TNCV_2058481 [Trichonephila clavipes]|nr:hypothetical protein TNCV_2058481 [Trichonephila clavipes]
MNLWGTRTLQLPCFNMEVNWPQLGNLGNDAKCTALIVRHWCLYNCPQIMKTTSIPLFSPVENICPLPLQLVYERGGAEAKTIEKIYPYTPSVHNLAGSKNRNRQPLDIPPYKLSKIRLHGNSACKIQHWIFGYFPKKKKKKHDTGTTKKEETQLISVPSLQEKNKELSGRGSRVVKVSDRGWPCHEFEPSTTKDPSCRAAMHVKSVECSNVLLLERRVPAHVSSMSLDHDGDRFNSCQVIYSQFGLAIHQNDHQARRRFVEGAQNEIAVVPDFHKRILFSDEAHFWLNGYVNKQNCRIWSEANPQVYVETPLHPEKLTVWCALWAGGILLQKR